MAQKKISVGVGDVALLVLSLFFVVGILAIFHPCGAKDDGSWMTCHWAGNAVAGLSVVLAVIAVVHCVVQNSGVKCGLDLAAIPVALFAAILPGTVVSLCMMETMRCHTVMRPAVVVVSALIVVAAGIDLVLQKKRLAASAS